MGSKKTTGGGGADLATNAEYVAGVATNKAPNVKQVVDSHNLKANKTSVTSNLALKANKTAVASSLALKADKTAVTSGLALKADKTAITGKADTDLSNVDSNISEADRTAFRDKLSISGGGSGSNADLATDAEYVAGIATVKAPTVKQVVDTHNLKADTDLQNIDNDLTDAEKETIKTKLDLDEALGLSTLEEFNEGQLNTKAPTVRQVVNAIDSLPDPIPVYDELPGASGDLFTKTNLSSNFPSVSSRSNNYFSLDSNHFIKYYNSSLYLGAVDLVNPQNSTLTTLATFTAVGNAKISTGDNKTIFTLFSRGSYPNRIFRLFRTVLNDNYIPTTTEITKDDNSVEFPQNRYSASFEIQGVSSDTFIFYNDPRVGGVSSIIGTFVVKITGNTYTVSTPISSGVTINATFFYNVITTSLRIDSKTVMLTNNVRSAFYTGLQKFYIQRFNDNYTAFSIQESEDLSNINATGLDYASTFAFDILAPHKIIIYGGYNYSSSYARRKFSGDVFILTYNSAYTSFVSTKIGNIPTTSETSSSSSARFYPGIIKLTQEKVITFNSYTREAFLLDFDISTLLSEGVKGILKTDVGDLKAGLYRHNGNTWTQVAGVEPVLEVATNEEYNAGISTTKPPSVLQVTLTNSLKADNASLVSGLGSKADTSLDNVDSNLTESKKTVIKDKLGVESGLTKEQLAKLSGIDVVINENLYPLILEKGFRRFGELSTTDIQFHRAGFLKDLGSAWLFAFGTNEETVSTSGDIEVFSNLENEVSVVDGFYLERNFLVQQGLYGYDLIILFHGHVSVSAKKYTVRTKEGELEAVIILDTVRSSSVVQKEYANIEVTEVKLTLTEAQYNAIYSARAISDVQVEFFDEQDEILFVDRPLLPRVRFKAMKRLIATDTEATAGVEEEKVLNVKQVNDSLDLKANTDLGNVNDNLTDAEKTSIRNKLGSGSEFYIATNAEYVAGVATDKATNVEQVVNSLSTKANSNLSNFDIGNDESGIYGQSIGSFAKNTNIGNVDGNRRVNGENGIELSFELPETSDFTHVSIANSSILALRSPGAIQITTHSVQDRSNSQIHILAFAWTEFAKEFVLFQNTNVVVGPLTQGQVRAIFPVNTKVTIYESINSLNKFVLLKPLSDGNFLDRKNNVIVNKLEKVVPQ